MTVSWSTRAWFVGVEIVIRKLADGLTADSGGTAATTAGAGAAGGGDTAAGGGVAQR